MRNGGTGRLAARGHVLEPRKQGRGHRPASPVSLSLHCPGARSPPLTSFASSTWNPTGLGPCAGAGGAPPLQPGEKLREPWPAWVPHLHWGGSPRPVAPEPQPEEAGTEMWVWGTLARVLPIIGTRALSTPALPIVGQKPSLAVAALLSRGRVTSHSQLLGSQERP